jgi:hypothetical protein
LATTLQTLITRVRQRTMLENDQSSTDLEITDYLNSSLAFLDSILKQQDDYDITSVSNTISNVATPYFAVPADFFKLRMLEMLAPSNPNYYITLKQFSLRTKNRYNTSMLTPFAFSTGICNLAYRVMLPNIYIEPAQFCTGTFRLWYTPVYTLLVNTTDALPAYMDTQAWNEYAVCDVAAKLMDKQGLDPSSFYMRAMSAKQTVEADSAVIDRGSVKVIEDTRDDGSGGGFGNGWNW